MVTIIAQVDHGKTTLADSLIEANGIISERMAGTLRYLDSMEEEQRRGITMRTSAIGLKHTYRPSPKADPQNVVLHLLDSPGHTDFAPEVSSALQSCDTALLVVDVVEGMSARTHQVLREAHAHQLVPILVLNKVDRLCTDLCLSPTEAYMRLRGLLESVNAATAAMLVSKTAEEELDSDTRQKEEELWAFEPLKGNVVFASAIHGWGFSVPGLSRSLFRSKTLPIKPMLLKQYLFGDYKYKGGKILKWKASTDEADPLFAEFALQPIWSIYEGLAAAASAIGIGSNLFADGRASINHTKGNNSDSKISSEAPGMDQVLETMQAGGTGPQIPATQAELQQILTKTGSSTEETALRSLVRRYRPLSDAVLDAVCEHGPSPDVAARTVRTRALALAEPSTDNRDGFDEMQSAVAACRPRGPAVAHVCKFVSADRSDIRDPDLPGDANEDNIHLIMGVARVLCGTLRTDEAYFWMGPKHTFGSVESKRKIRLYLLMGSSFVRVDEVPAGHLCAVYGLEDLQLKTVTLSDSPKCMSLQGFDRGVRPLVKVNVEPVAASDTDALERGLLKLSLADAAIEVTATAKGERILACLGELHLEQSILDLEKRYCGKEMKLRISEPIVEFGETTDWFGESETSDYVTFCNTRDSAPLRQTTIPPYCEEEGIELASRGRMRAVVSGKAAAVGVRVVPLSESIYHSLQSKSMVEGSKEDIMVLGRALGCGAETPETVYALLLDTLSSVDSSGNAFIVAKGLASGTCVKGVVSADGVYVNRQNKESEEASDEVVGGGKDEYEEVLKSVRSSGLAGPKEVDTSEADRAALDIWTTKLVGSSMAGFLMAMRSGPLCEEPVRGVLVVLESLEVALQHTQDGFTTAKPLSGGMLVTTLRQGIRCALLSRPARLLERHLKLTLHSSLAGLGSLYAVLSRRRGKVLEDSMVDGTDLLLITATLPQAESFHLTPELMSKSSGEVTVPELTFLKWEKLDQDPFWIPTSLEEREDFGEIIANGDVSTGIDNHALTYIRKVRERKGLLVDSSRTVVAAEKQRTLKR